MASIFQMTFWNGFSWMNIYEFDQNFIKLFFKLTKLQYWFRWWLGDKPLSEPMMVSLLTHICTAWFIDTGSHESPKICSCVIRPQLVNYLHRVRYNFCTHPVSQWPKLGAFGYTDRCLGYPGISWRCIPMFPVCFPACARSHGTWALSRDLRPVSVIWAVGCPGTD